MNTRLIARCTGPRPFDGACGFLRRFGWCGHFVMACREITPCFRFVCFTPDCVAKLFAAVRSSNYRIRLSTVLNRRCAPVLVLESILLSSVAKIVLQHNPPESRHREVAAKCLLRAKRRHSHCSRFSYSITSSASESRLSEIWMPSAFAVLRLITSSNLLTVCTGRSAGLPPASTFAA
jgi:hypothetical protein